MSQLFANNAKTTVAVTFAATDMTLEVLDGSKLPSPANAEDYFLLTLFRIDGNNQETGHEVIKCSARSGNTITVDTRSYEGAAASQFEVGAVVAARLTAKSMENLIAAAVAAVELIYDNFDDRYLGAKSADPSTDNDGDPLSAGLLYFNTTTFKMRVYGGGAWQDAASAVEGLGQTFNYTAADDQTVFSGNDDTATPMVFDSTSNLIVFLNGVRLVNGVDYTADDSANSITLTVGASKDDVLSVDAFSYFSSAPLASKVQTETGDDNTSLMTPLRTAQAINASPRKNYIINGNFDNWQRGTSFSSAAGYSADRWRFDEGDGSSTVTRQAFSVGQADVPNEPTYFLRHDRTVAATATTAAIEQRTEGVRSLAGRTATVSFYAKAGANKTFTVDFAQSFGTGGSPSAGLAIAVGDINVTTAWQKFTFTVAVPSIAGKTIGTNNDDYLTFRIKETSSFSLFTIDISEVQVEKGSVATDFEYRHVGEELALCKRYGRKVRYFARQYTDGSTALYYPYPLSPNMRAIPSMTVDTVLTSVNITSATLASSTTDTDFQLSLAVTAAGIFTYVADIFLDAEL